jgi:hypothetical protein
MFTFSLSSFYNTIVLNQAKRYKIGSNYKLIQVGCKDGSKKKNVRKFDYRIGLVFFFLFVPIIVILNQITLLYVIYSIYFVTRTEGYRLRKHICHMMITLKLSKTENPNCPSTSAATLQPFKSITLKGIPQFSQSLALVVVYLNIPFPFPIILVPISQQIDCRICSSEFTQLQNLILL